MKKKFYIGNIIRVIIYAVAKLFILIKLKNILESQIEVDTTLVKYLNLIDFVCFLVVSDSILNMFYMSKVKDMFKKIEDK